MPNLYIIAGPNGAGKTTCAMTVLPEYLAVENYVNADAIASALSPFHPEREALAAGRLMLGKIKELIAKQEHLAFETTLASRSFVPLVHEAREQGYNIYVIFIFLANSTVAKKRVAFRVKAGGHNIPGDVIERRYKAGLINLFDLYMPIVDGWYIYDNTDSVPILVAQSDAEREIIWEDARWTNIKARHACVNPKV